MCTSHIITVTSSPFLGHHDSFNIDFWVASTEQTTFAELRARFDHDAINKKTFRGTIKKFRETAKCIGGLRGLLHRSNASKKPGGDKEPSLESEPMQGAEVD